MMICHYFSFLINEIWLDWWNNILLFLFSAFTVLNLIYGIRASSIILDRPLGSRGSGLHFGLASGGPGTLHFSRLGEWAGRPVFLTLSIAPSPCVRNAWARAVTLLTSIAGSTCLLGVGLIKT